MRFEYSTKAKCKPEHVWQVFADINRWAEWNPVISRAEWISGSPWQLGSRFLMDIIQPRKIRFQPVITESGPPHRVAWTGKAFGFKGTHWHEFTIQPDGTTLIKTWEQMSGFLTWFIGPGMKRRLMNMYAVWISSLAAESEKVANPELAKRS